MTDLSLPYHRFVLLRTLNLMALGENRRSVSIWSSDKLGDIPDDAVLAPPSVYGTMQRVFFKEQNSLLKTANLNQ